MPFSSASEAEEDEDGFENERQVVPQYLSTRRQVANEASIVRRPKLALPPENRLVESDVEEVFPPSTQPPAKKKVVKKVAGAATKSVHWSAEELEDVENHPPPRVVKARPPQPAATGGPKKNPSSPGH